MTLYENANVQTKLIIILVALMMTLTGGVWLGSMVLEVGLTLPNKSFRTLINYSFYSNLSSQQKIWLFIGWGIAAIPSFFLLFFMMKRKKTSLYGKTRFANIAEIKKADLKEKKGILCGKYKSTYLYFGGTEHVIVYAPTRSGKGVGIVIPNLLTWQDSVVVLDIKKENWVKTAGFRQSHGIEVFMFDPVEPNGQTHRYNPLSYVRKGTEFQIDDLQRIAAMLIPVSDKDPFFDLSAQKAFVATAAYMAETQEKPFTIGQIFRELTSQSDIKNHFLQIMEMRGKSHTPLSRTTVNALNDFLSTSDDTLSSIRATVTSRLSLWLNPLIDAATAASDFDFDQLRRKRISVYVGITPDNLGRLAPLINLFFQQAIDINLRQLPEHEKSLNRKLLLLMDEFTALGRMEIISKGVAFLAGYNIRLLLVIQSPSQLDEIYGKEAAKSMMTNCAVEIVFTPKDLDVAQQLSERIGYNTIAGKSQSKARGFKGGNNSETISDQRRALLLPQELTQMSDEKALIFRRGIPPILANKIRYFKEPAFKERYTLPPPQIQNVRARSVTSPTNQWDILSTPENMREIKKIIKPKTEEQLPISEELPNPKSISDIDIDLTYGEAIKEIQNIDNDEELRKAILEIVTGKEENHE